MENFTVDTFAERVVSSLRITASNTALLTSILYRRNTEEGWFPVPTATAKKLPIALGAGYTDYVFEAPVYARYLDLLGTTMENIVEVQVNVIAPFGAGDGIEISNSIIAVKLDSISQLVISPTGLKLIDTPTFTDVTFSNGQDAGNISAVGAGDTGVSIDGMLEINKENFSASLIRFIKNSLGNILQVATITSTRTWTLPDRSGTVAVAAASPIQISATGEISVNPSAALTIGDVQATSLRGVHKSNDGTTGATVTRSWTISGIAHTVTVKDGIITSWTADPV